MDNICFVDRTVKIPRELYMFTSSPPQRRILMQKKNCTKFYGFRRLKRESEISKENRDQIKPNLKKKKFLKQEYNGKPKITSKHEIIIIIIVITKQSGPGKMAFYDLHKATVE